MDDRDSQRTGRRALGKPNGLAKMSRRFPQMYVQGRSLLRLVGEVLEFTLASDQQHGSCREHRCPLQASNPSAQAIRDFQPEWLQDFPGSCARSSADVKLAPPIDDLSSVILTRVRFSERRSEIPSHDGPSTGVQLRGQTLGPNHVQLTGSSRDAGRSLMCRASDAAWAPPFQALSGNAIAGVQWRIRSSRVLK